MFQAAIDFDPGMHGHFLEYICNKYIFNVSITGSPFFKSGSAHAINSDNDYQQNKLVTSGHYTYFNLLVNGKQVVYIKHNPKFDLVLLSNIFHRCFGHTGNAKDVDPQEILNWHLDQMKNDNTTESASIFKENIYAKLMERNHFQPAEVSRKYSNEVFEFDFGSFFNLTDFLQALQDLSNFFGQMLIVPKELVEDWHRFIDNNQGYQIYQRVNYLLEKTLAGQDEPIEDNSLIHAGINVYLARITRLYDSELHGEGYPNNTKQLNKILTRHFVEYNEKYQ